MRRRRTSAARTSSERFNSAITSGDDFHLLTVRTEISRRSAIDCRDRPWAKNCASTLATSGVSRRADRLPDSVSVGLLRRVVIYITSYDGRSGPSSLRAAGWPLRELGLAPCWQQL